MAAAEEVLVPMDDSILAGPANPAIAFRDGRLPRGVKADEGTAKITGQFPAGSFFLGVLCVEAFSVPAR